jgi:hypothetical protein
LLRIAEVPGYDGRFGALALPGAVGAPGDTTRRARLERLRRATPPEHYALLDEWWSQPVLYDLSVTSATATRLPDGRYRVDAKIDATKAAVREGQETALAMDDSLEVAIYAEYPNGSAASPSPLFTVQYGGRGPTELALIVDQQPRLCRARPAAAPHRPQPERQRAEDRGGSRDEDRSAHDASAMNSAR